MIRKLDLSPEVFRMLLIASGLSLAFFCYSFLQDSIKEMSYQPVYGENISSQVSPVSPRTLALPVVEASQPLETAHQPVADDALIESAFNFSEPEQVTVTVDVPVRITLAQQLVYRYQPRVQGVGAGGAFIRGQFWSVGEQIQDMPIRDDKGALLYPSIQSISSVQVVLSLGSESLPLPLQGIK